MSFVQLFQFHEISYKRGDSGSTLESCDETAYFGFSAKQFYFFRKKYWSPLYCSEMITLVLVDLFVVCADFMRAVCLPVF